MKEHSFLQRAIVFFFHLLVITVPFFFNSATSELFEFNKMLLTYGITAVLVALWITRIVTHKKIIWQKTAFDIPILLFVLSQIIATIFSMHPRTSWLGYYTRFHGGLLSTLTYVALFYAFIANVKKTQVIGFIWSLLFAGLGIALYSIPEHFGISPSCIVITGQADVSCWIQDVQSRIFGTFGQPNWLAAYVLTLLPLSVAFACNSSVRKKHTQTMVSILITACLFLTLIFTGSRSGFLGFAASAVVFALGFIAFRVHRNKTVHTTLIGISSLFLIIGVLFGTPFTPSSKSLLQGSITTTEQPMSPTAPATPPPVTNRLENGGTDSGEIRKIVWKGAFEIWKRYPVFGSGVETFAYSYYLDRPIEHNSVSEWDFLYNKAHNELLNYLATTGLVGLTSYILLVTFLIFKPLHVAIQNKTSDSIKLLTIANASGLVGLAVSNFFGFSTVMVTILMFLLPACYIVLTLKAEKDSTNLAKKPDVSFVQLLGFGVIIVTLLLCLTQILAWWRADISYNTGKYLADAGQIGQAAEFTKRAIELVPNEAIFHDELGQIYAETAVTLLQQNEATAAATYTQTAKTASAATFQLNPVHLNFYKTQARLFLVLGNIDPEYFSTALHILRQGSERAPSDAKIWYNIALLEDSLGNSDQAQQTLEQTIVLKPNYEQARMSLAELYEKQGNYLPALEQYQTVLESIAPGNTIAARKIKVLEASISAQQP